MDEEKEKMDMDVDSAPVTVHSTPKLEDRSDDRGGEDDDEDDPVTETYSVFINPALPSGRRLLVLQQPNRTDEHPRPPPTELRIKSRTGMVELDIPLDATVAYDKEKGMRWGRNLKASMQAKGGGSHGVAGGFAVGAVQQRGGGGRGRSAAAQAAEEEDLMMDWNEAARQGKVLTTQTLGGQYPDVGDVQYMVGVFQDKHLHLTPVSSLVHLRPQPHHIDAMTHLERQSSAKEGAASGSGSGAGAGTGAAGARAIHMTIKATAEGDAVTTETMADRLRAVQSESWRRMQFTDENTESAWDVYNESLFLGPSESTVAEGEANGKKEDHGNGKAKDDEEAEDEKKDSQDDLEASVPTFQIRWGDKELLEAVSDIKKPEPKAIEPVTKKPANKEVDKGKQPEVPAVPEPPKHKPATRTRGGGAVGVRRGGRPKATLSRGAASSANAE